MNGLGARPFPAAISLIARPEATERSSASSSAPPSERALASRCLMSSQFVRLPPLRSRFMRTRTQLPCRRSPSRTNFKSPESSDCSGDLGPSGVQ